MFFFCSCWYNHISVKKSILWYNVHFFIQELFMHHVLCAFCWVDAEDTREASRWGSCLHGAHTGFLSSMVPEHPTYFSLKNMGWSHINALVQVCSQRVTHPCATWGRGMMVPGVIEQTKFRLFRIYCPAGLSKFLILFILDIASFFLLFTSLSSFPPSFLSLSLPFLFFFFF